MTNRAVAAWRQSVVWVHFGKKIRPAVVLEVTATHAVVFIAGPTQEKSWRGVTVAAGTPSWRVMGLRDTTYFYANNVGWLPLEAVREVAGNCPFGLFGELRALAEERALALRNQVLEHAAQRGHEAVGSGAAEPAVPAKPAGTRPRRRA